MKVSKLFIIFLVTIMTLVAGSNANKVMEPSKVEATTPEQTVAAGEENHYVRIQFCTS